MKILVFLYFSVHFSSKLHIEYLKRFRWFSILIWIIKKSTANVNFFKNISKSCSRQLPSADGMQPKSKTHAKLEVSIRLKTSQRYKKKTLDIIVAVIGAVIVVVFVAVIVVEMWLHHRMKKCSFFVTNAGSQLTF